MSETIEQVKKDLEFFESKGYYPKRLASSLTSALYSLITTIESQNKYIATFDNIRQLAESKIESQKEEIEKLESHKIVNNYRIMLTEIESLKAITELAVKGLEEVASGKDWSHIMAQKAKIILEKIERLQNEST